MTTDRDRPMLTCYDGSEAAKHAIESAASLVGRGRRAVVVTVWQPTADTGSVVRSDVVADRSDAAVIAIGSRGHTVVHHAHQPTLVIHMPAHDSAVAKAIS